MDVELDNLEELLRDSGQRLRDLFESLPLGVYRTTPDGRILIANSTLVRMLGFSSFAELAAVNLEQESHSSYPRGLFKERLARDGEIRALETSWQRSDGTLVFMCEHARAIRDKNGRIRYYEGTVEDITERKQAAEKLQASEQQLAEAQQLARMGSWELDIASDRLNWSDEHFRLFGYYPQEFSPTYETGLQRIHPADRARVDEACRQALRDHQPFSVEYRVVLPDGTVRCLQGRGKVLTDAAGQVVKLLGTAHDITERKQAEEERSELLRRLVSAQEEERRRLALELHDQLGQDVTALLLGLKAVQEQGEPSAPSERLPALMRLADELGRKVHRIAWELRPSALDDLGLPVMLRNYLEEWAGRCNLCVDFHSNGLDTERLPPQTEIAIYRIIQEALTNVVKHAGARHVSVLLERRPVRALVIVEDDGRGFDTEAVLRAANTERRMGLIGMHERARLVGGELEIESVPGAGTTIYVRIPLAG